MLISIDSDYNINKSDHFVDINEMVFLLDI